MSYLVLARKYRPTTFAEVVGQEHVTRTLGNAFASGRLHHAFLFCGPRGVGKTTLARILGKALNCEQGPTSTPCGTCSACTSIAQGSSVDYNEMDGASNRGIDAIRELTESVRYQPAILRKKVYVIDEVHMLTTEAFNALLKTLEEPPPHVTFVLATTEPHKLPNTILSRCQRYDMKLVAASKLAGHLDHIFKAEKLSIDAAAVSLIVRESGGSVRDALSLCDQLISFVGDEAITEAAVAEVLGVADRALTRQLVGALTAADPSAALVAVDAAADRGVDEIQVARAIVRYLRDLAVLQAAPQHPHLVDATDEERAELMTQAKALPPSRVSQMFERMLRCCDDLGKTLQPRLVLEFALIDAATLEPVVPLGDLIERLGDLERGASRGGSGGGGGGGGSRSAPARPASSAPSPSPSAPPRTQRTEAAEPAAKPPAPATPAPAPAPAAAKPAPARDAGPPPFDPEAAPAGHPNAPVEVRAEGSSRAPMTRAAPTPPVAAPASAPVSVPVDAGPVQPKLNDPTSWVRAWDSVLLGLENSRRMTLSGYFQHARVMAWGVDAIELGFSTDFHNLGEMAREKTRIDEMRSFLREHFGKPYNIAVRLLDEAESSNVSARSVVEVSRERTDGERRAREKEAREHPMTKMVLKTFGADIKEIKTDV